MENQEAKKMVSRLPLEFLKEPPESMDRVMGRIECDVVGITDSVYKITATVENKKMDEVEIRNHAAATAAYFSTFRKELGDLGNSLQKFLNNCGVEKFSDVVAVDGFPDTQTHSINKERIKELLADSLGYSIGNFSDMGNKKTENTEVIDMLIKSKAFAYAVDLDIIPEIAFRSVGVSEDKPFEQKPSRELVTQLALELYERYHQLEKQSQPTNPPKDIGGLSNNSPDKNV